MCKGAGGGEGGFHVACLIQEKRKIEEGNVLYSARRYTEHTRERERGKKKEKKSQHTHLHALQGGSLSRALDHRFHVPEPLQRALEGVPPRLFLSAVRSRTARKKKEAVNVQSRVCVFVLRS